MFYITVDDEISLYLIQEHHHPIIFELLENNREHLNEHMGAFDQTLEDTRQACRRAQKDFATNGSLILLITYHDQSAGSISLHNRTGGSISGAEIGYWLAKEFVGQGIMTRAVKILTDYAFTHLEVNRVFMGIATNNTRSFAIPERLGFRVEGTLRQNDTVNGKWVDHRTYTMLKSEWTQPQNPPILRYPIDDTLDMRLVEERYVEAYFAGCDANRKHIGEWLPWVDQTKTVDDSMAFVHECLQQYSEHNGFQAGIWQGNQFVGMIGYIHWNFINNHTEIGYWLAKDANGRGIITKCTRALVDYAFNIVNLNRVVIRCAVGNEKSGNVAKRLGFTHEGIERQGIKLRDYYTDVHVYSILSKEWQTK